MAVEDYSILLELLKRRFEKNPGRHQGFLWLAIEKKLKENPGKLHSLNEMEKTGGAMTARSSTGWRDRAGGPWRRSSTGSADTTTCSSTPRSTC